MALRVTSGHESRSFSEENVILNAAKDLHFRLFYVTFNGAGALKPLNPGYGRIDISRGPL
jgi:hypothetical protein